MNHAEIEDLIADRRRRIAALEDLRKAPSTTPDAWPEIDRIAREFQAEIEAAQADDDDKLGAFAARRASAPTWLRESNLRNADGSFLVEPGTVQLVEDLGDLEALRERIAIGQVWVRWDLLTTDAEQDIAVSQAKRLTKIVRPQPGGQVGHRP